MLASMPESRGPGGVADPVDHPAEAVLRAAEARTGVDLRSYRRSTILRRLHGRMLAIGCDSLDDYHEIVSASEAEAFRLLERVTIKVSRFYRNRATFDLLRHQVFPALAARRSGTALRLWSAGCAHGEEAYTLAMLLEELEQPGVVIATDVDPTALVAAARAVYPPAAVSELPGDLAARFLEPCDVSSRPMYRVTDRVRARVRLGRHDLVAAVSPPDATTVDLVACRNVLIYLAGDARTRVTELLGASLADDGVLCLGEAEWPPPAMAASLEVVSRPCRIFRAGGGKARGES
jgi:chemotaxis methyl-accepting protein methylase